MTYEYEKVLTPSSGLRLHLNENTAGCSPKVIDALRALSRTDIGFYPDYDEVVSACAARLGVVPEQLVLTNGLDEGILAITVEALRERGAFTPGCHRRRTGLRHVRGDGGRRRRTRRGGAARACIRLSSRADSRGNRTAHAVAVSHESEQPDRAIHPDIRRSRHASLKRDGLGQIKNAVSISERPASIEDRAVPGHWEGDLIGGTGNSYVATLVERHSRYVMLVKVANKDTESVVSALIKQSLRLPSELYRSLTWDRGKELADHQRLTLATEVESIFAILGLPGSAGQMKTPIDCCANIFHGAPICPYTARPSLARLQGS